MELREMFMERCVFCQAALDANARLCKQCGRAQPQPSGALNTTPAPDASGPLNTLTSAVELLAGACLSCGKPAQRADRFCKGCGCSLRAPCPACKQEAPHWAVFCPQCAQPLRALPAGKRAGDVSAVPVVPTGASLASPQDSALRVSSTPGGFQSGAPVVPNALEGAQGSPPPELYATAAHAESKSAGQSLHAKLVGTTTGKVITIILALAVIVTGIAAVVAKVNASPSAGRTSATPTQIISRINLSPYIGEWGHHDYGLTINADGIGKDDDFYGYSDECGDTGAYRHGTLQFTPKSGYAVGIYTSVTYDQCVPSDERNLHSGDSFKLTVASHGRLLLTWLGNLPSGYDPALWLCGSKTSLDFDDVCGA
jgi:hypothetical protein